jgi:hypothetical protein
MLFAAGRKQFVRSPVVPLGLLKYLFCALGEELADFINCVYRGW